MRKEISGKLKEICPPDQCICEECADKYNNNKLSAVQAALKIYRQ